MISTTVLKKISKIVGNKHLITAQDAMVEYATDGIAREITKVWAGVINALDKQVVAATAPPASRDDRTGNQNHERKTP